MPFAFPAASVGDTSTQNGRGYRYVGNNVWELVPASGEDSLLRSLFVPPAPTGLTASAGNAQVSLSWTAPTGVISQAPVSDYREQYSTDNGATWTTFTAAASTATTATIGSLANGTAYVFRVAAVNAVGTGNYTAASTAVTPTAGDPLFSNVALLLRMDGSGGTFIDSSASPKSITAGGNATQSATQSKFGGKSAYFAAAGDYLSLADSDAIELSNKDFALEFWAQTTNSTQYATLVSRSPGAYSSGSWSLLMNLASSTSGDIALFASDIGSPIVQSSGVNLRDGAWHHVAVSRSGSNWSLYVDGTRVGTGTSSATVANIAGGLRIGADEFYGRGFTGYIDEFRLTLNSARGYTGSTITVPVAAFPDSA